MKVTLAHEDVLEAVRSHLARQGFKVPEVTDTDAFSVFCDENAEVSIEVSNISVAPVEIAIPEPRARAQVAAPSVRNNRFEPEPSPPREKLTEPDRILGEDEPLPERVDNERGIKSMVAQSHDMVRRTPDPAKIPHKAARERFPKVQYAESIEGLGKDPNDYKDEV